MCLIEVQIQEMRSYWWCCNGWITPMARRRCAFYNLFVIAWFVYAVNGSICSFVSLWSVYIINENFVSASSFFQWLTEILFRRKKRKRKRSLTVQMWWNIFQTYIVSGSLSLSGGKSPGADAMLFTFPVALDFSWKCRSAKKKRLLSIQDWRWWLNTEKMKTRPQQ